MRVRLRVVDVHGDPKASARALRRLAADGVRVVVGPEASSEVAAVRAAAGALGVAVLSQGSTAHSLAIRGDGIFRFVPDDVRESEALVALLKRDGIDAIVPVWRNDTGNSGLATSVRKRFKGSIARGVRYGTNVSVFGPTLSELRAQVASLRSGGASRVAVYLAGFDEVSQLFETASDDPVLGALPWYGSDGVALSRRLVGTPKAAAFASSVGYPNPILGLDDAAAKRARRLVARIRAQLGHRPDTFALTAYDALQVAVDARVRSGNTSDAKRFERALVSVAHGYMGVTGRLLLNSAGDRAFGSYDFWSVCMRGGSASWKRTWSYLSRRPGHGRIVAREHC
jgi:branched-chain amino acid transport system substrate-binding protein